MSAPTDVCQCEAPVTDARKRTHCHLCGLKKRAARGLPPESQGEAIYYIPGGLTYEQFRKAQLDGDFDGCCFGDDDFNESAKTPAPHPAGSQGEVKPVVCQWCAERGISTPCVHLNPALAPQPAEPCAQGVECGWCRRLVADCKCGEHGEVDLPAIRQQLTASAARIAELTAQLSGVTRDRDALTVKIESAFRRGFRYGRSPNTFEAEAWTNYQNDPTK